MKKIEKASYFWLLNFLPGLSLLLLSRNGITYTAGNTVSALNNCIFSNNPILFVAKLFLCQVFLAIRERVAEKPLNYYCVD